MNSFPKAVFVRATLTALGLLAAGGATPASAQTLISQNFDAEPLGTRGFYYLAVGTTFGGFTVTRGSIDVIGPGWYDPLPGNGNYIDLDGTDAGSAGRFESADLSLNPGTYQFSFRLAGSQRETGGPNSVTISLGSHFSESFTRNDTDPFALFTRNIHVAAAGTAKLVFDHIGADNNGLLLDDVTLVRSEAPAVPEPHAALLFAPVLALFGLIRLRDRRQKGSSGGTNQLRLVERGTKGD